MLRPSAPAYYKAYSIHYSPSAFTVRTLNYTAKQCIQYATTADGLSSYPRLQAQSNSSDGDHGGGGGEVELVDGYNVFYGIAVVCLSVFLFGVLAASLSVSKALAFAALAALLLSVAGRFASATWFRCRRGSSTAELLVVTVTAAVAPTGTARPRAPSAGGYPSALVNAPPAFAYECTPVVTGGGSGHVPAAASSCYVVCPVCLEDVRGGQMVRQVPVCRHIFHVECIDMWMHSHRTCPVCRA